MDADDVTVLREEIASVESALGELIAAMKA